MVFAEVLVEPDQQQRGEKPKIEGRQVAEISNLFSANYAVNNIRDLLSKKIMVKNVAGGRSTGYVIKPPDKNLHLTE